MPHFIATAKTLLSLCESYPIRKQSAEKPAGHLPIGPLREHNPLDPPDLAYTGIKAKFCGEEFNNWSALVWAGVKAAILAGHSCTELRQVVVSNFQEDVLNEKGFTPIPGMNLSVQGMEANKAWRDALALAQTLDTEIEVVFRWYMTDNVPAERRGQSGLLRWLPSS